MNLFNTKSANRELKLIRMIRRAGLVAEKIELASGTHNITQTFRNAQRLRRWQIKWQIELGRM